MKTTLEMLRELVAFADSVEDEESLQWAPAMRDMLGKYSKAKFDGYSKRQKEFVADVYERVVDSPVYLNAWSAGQIPKGEISTPVPDVLRKPLPMRPPGRR